MRGTLLGSVAKYERRAINIDAHTHRRHRDALGSHRTREFGEARFTGLSIRQQDDVTARCMRRREVLVGRIERGKNRRTTTRREPSDVALNRRAIARALQWDEALRDGIEADHKQCIVG